MASFALERCEAKRLLLVMVQDKIHGIIAQVACAVVEHNPVAQLRKSNDRSVNPSVLESHLVLSNLNPQP